MPRADPISTKTAPNPGASRRVALLQAAARLFDEHGYHRTSMEDIAQAAGIAKPTLYHYFRSKDEMLFELHAAMIDAILASHERRVEDQPANWPELLRGVIGDIVGLMESHPGQLRVFFEHYRELPDPYRASIREKRNRYRSHVQEVIARGMAAGSFAESDPELATLAVLGLSNWSYQWLRQGGSRTADEVTQAFYRLIVNGLAPRGDGHP